MAKAPLFSQLFGRSPIAPLQEHMEIVARCAAELKPFLEAVVLQDWELAETVGDRISEIEQQADDLKRDIRLNLPKSLLLPVARSDLLEMVSSQDKVANIAKDIAGIIRGRKAIIPESMVENIRAFLDHSIRAAGFANQTLAELDEVIESGFSGKEITTVQKLMSQLSAAESDSDKLQIEVRYQLFQLEKDLPPVDAMFLYKIIDLIGELADTAERVGHRMLYFIAR